MQPSSKPSSMPAVEVTLRSLDCLDEFDERRFVIAPNATVPIGRSSKNATKRLMAARDNAYIDSPVISREHATLSANTTLGVPNVYITDNGSMHGTKINGGLVARQREHRLSNGDKLQFGVDVIRDQGKDQTFTAKSYQFTSRLAPTESARPFPRGFSVPSEVSSDEEDGSFISSSPRAPSYGSQRNPVNIEDFEDRHETVIDLEDEEDVIVHPMASLKPTVAVAVEEVKVIPNTPVIDFSDPIRDSSPASSPAPLLSLARDDISSDDGFSDHHDDDTRSVGSSEASMDSQEVDSVSEDNIADSSSDSEGSDHDDEEDRGQDAVRRLKLGAMLNYEQHKTSTNVEVPASPYVAAAPVPAFQSTANAQPPAPLSNPPKVFGSHSTAPEPERYKPSQTEQTGIFADDYMSNPWMSSPPVPSRPSAPKPIPWSQSSMPYSNTPSYMRESNQHNPWYEEPSVNVFGFPINDFRPHDLQSLNRVPSSFGGLPNPLKPYVPSSSYTFPESSTAPAKPDSVLERNQSVDVVATTGMPTPPMPYSDKAGPSTPQHNLRTKVSIAEIVETTPRPQTPSLKRKADVLDDENDEATKEAKTLNVPQTAQVFSSPPTVVERPQKRLKSSLQYFAGTVAAGAIGAAAVVGGLMFLPDAVFV